MRLRKRTGLAVLALLLPAALGGCEEAQEDRVLIEEKGEYQGPADRGLTESEVDALRNRVRLQGDS